MLDRWQNSYLSGWVKSYQSCRDKYYPLQIGATVNISCRPRQQQRFHAKHTEAVHGPNACGKNGRGLSMNRDPQTRMTNDEIRKNDQIRIRKRGTAQRRAIGHSGFGFLSSLVLGPWSFVIQRLAR